MSNWSNRHTIAPHDESRLTFAEAAEDHVAAYLGGDAVRVSINNSKTLYDILAAGLFIDVKTKPRNVVASVSFDAHVEASQKDYPVDIYVFCSSQKWDGKTEMMGWIWKEVFFDEARFVQKDELDDGFEEKADAYKLPYFFLYDMEDLKAMQGEFWLVKNKDELVERLQNFGRWAKENWDWEKPMCWKAQEFKPLRSYSQNNLFHVWCREMAEFFRERGVMVTVTDDDGDHREPMTEQDAKDILKLRFLGTYEMSVGKTVIPNKVKSTSKLNTGEMFHFMEQVHAWLIDNGVPISDPEDSEFRKLQREGL